jgi:putative ABC transport system permease protein
MDEIFGLSMTTLMWAILVVLGIIAGVLALLASRNPLLFRLGLRNVPRRKAQTGLIVFGLMLSTLIISSAFTTGDTLSTSLRSTAFRIAGPIDHLVQYDTDAGRSVSARESVVPQAIVDDLKDHFADDPEVLGFVRALFDNVSMFNQETQQLLPLSFLLGLDPAEVDAVGGIPALDGGRLNLDLLGERGIILNQTAARELAAEVGHTIEITALRERQNFQVVAIAEDTLLSGEVNPAESQGAVIRLVDAQTIFDQAGVVTGVGVHTTGGIRGALKISDEVDVRLNDFLVAQAEDEVSRREGNGGGATERLYADAQDRPIFESAPFKADAVNDAETFGSIFTSLFLVMGLFSIGAGILLIFLIFVLLAEERKSEMGISRAIGMRRWHLVETYLAEGSAYNVGSAFVGAVLGILVAFGMIEVLNTLGDDFGFEFHRHVEPRSLIVSAGIGIILVFITVTVSSYRVSNLNIVAAIRDIPESSLIQRRRISIPGLLTTTAGLIFLPLTIPLLPLGLLLTALPIIGGWIRRRGWAERTVLPIWSLMRWRPEWWFTFLAFGVLSLRVGISSETAFLYLLGLSLIPIGLLLLARRIHRAGRIAHSLMGIAILAIWLAPFDVHETLTGFDGEGDFELFFLSGAMMVTGGTVFIVFNLDVLAGSLRQIGRVFGRLRPVVQTAAAYPSTARFRTGMTVAMIAIIMFALVTFTTINSNFQRLFTSETATGGYAIQADANRNATFTDLRAALVEEGRPDLADQIEDVSTLSLASFFGTDVVGLEAQEWNEREETLVLDASGNPIPLDLEPELAESALDDDGNPLPGAEDDLANLRYQSAFFTGADDTFLSRNDVIFQTLAPGFEDDAAVWQALGQPLPDGSRYAVVTAQAVSEAGGAFAQQEDDDFVLPKFIEEETKRMPVVTALVRNPSSGETLTIRIIAVIDQIIGIAGPDFALRPSIIVDQDAFATLYDESDLVRHLTKLTPGTDPFLTAQAIEATLRVETVSIIDELKERQDTFRTILNLFQGFTGLGLFAGMAALGVIAVRAVVERRQQIGMLRAIGFSRGFIRLGMVLEMSFIAALGVSLGTVLAVVLSWRLFSEGAFGSTSGGSFFVPIQDIVVFVVIAMAASFILTYLPARQASRITIAEALRYE